MRARHASMVIALAIAFASVPLVAQSTTAGWKLVLRIIPNPIPIGRCAGISVELQDPDGFRTGVMSNGQSLDQRHMSFSSSNTTSFSWRDDKPTDGVVCTVATAPPALTKIRVVLPDGVAGEVVLTSLPPGVTATAVAYSPQAKLRPPGYVSGTPATATNASVAAMQARAATVVSTNASTGASATHVASGIAPKSASTAVARANEHVPAGSTSATVSPLEIYTLPIHGVGDCPTAASCPS